MDPKFNMEGKSMGVKQELREHAVNDLNQPRYDDKEMHKVLRKVDFHLMPMLTFLYLISFLDRGNIGNAKVAGMNVDLGLSSGQFNLALTVKTHNTGFEFWISRY